MSPQASRRPTIHDVARQAQVSITTVSHSLNGKGSVAEATRQRVISVAAELGYSADAIARGLREQKLGVLGLVMRPLDDLDSYQPSGVDYFMRFAGAAAIAALDRGYGLMLVRDPAASDAPAIALALDGFIIADPVENDPVIALLHRTGVPVVSVGRDIGRPDFTEWIGAGPQNVRTVLAHLWEKGARRITLVAGTDANAWNADSEQSYRSWASDMGMDAIVFHQEERSGEWGGRSVAQQLLDGGAIPDAVYCLTGRHAAGLQSRLSEAGIHSPRDTMIVAGSDSEQTRNSAPPITSVDLAPEKTARAAVDFLVARLSGDTEVRPPVVPTELILRASTEK